MNMSVIETPALLIDMDSLDFNIRKMAAFIKDKSAKLRPHFKTDKCLEISYLQLAAGAKGITCAKLSEAEILAAGGIKDILIANEIIDPFKIERLARLAGGGVKITVAVDNEENIRTLSEAAIRAGTVIHVLIEVDVGMKRCGVNTADEVLYLAKRVMNSKGLVFEGIQAYEGHLAHVQDTESRRLGVNEMVAKVSGIKAYLEKNGIKVKEISGGSTGTYDITGDNTIWTEIQAGSYIFMDVAYGKLGLGFKNALTVLATVIHKRPGVAITDAGIKVCGTDQGLPEIKGHKCTVTALNEEHGIIADETDELEYGQKIEYIPGHCCSTVNLHDKYHCMRNGLLEAVWPIEGRGKSQ
jgi:D-serine deaminase-like pyridoxal phosphate-dependent protein